MDLNDIWQGNRKFILGVGCALVLVLVGEAVVGSIWEVEDRFVSSRAAKLRSLKAPKQQMLSAVQSDNLDLQERLEALYARMNFKTDPNYLLPKTEPNPELLYNTIRLQARDELVTEAARRNIRVDETMGLPEFTPSGSEAIQRSLRGLNIVERVVLTAIVAGVRAIPEIEIIEDKGRRRKKNDSFIDPLRVRFRITGRSAAIAELFDGLVRGDGQFLCIEEAQIEADHKKAFGLTEAKITVSGLTIDPEAPVTGARK